MNKFKSKQLSLVFLVLAVSQLEGQKNDFFLTKVFFLKSH